MFKNVECSLDRCVYCGLGKVSSWCRSAYLRTINTANDTCIYQKERRINRHKIEWHRKFTLSFACLVLFFIGAPLGAIIRKGGFGMPVVVSILFFVAYHIISISGEKFAREGIMSPVNGMWLSAAILLPIGIALTLKATTDSALFDAGFYRKILKKIFKSKD